MSGLTPLPDTPIDLPLLPLRTADGGPNDSLVAAHAAIHDRTVNIADAYSAARDWAMDKPAYLQELTESQKQEFADLRASLRSIGGAIESGDRAAFNQVKGAIDAIEKTNAGLIQQLVVAKQENETLRNALLVSGARIARLQTAASDNARLTGMLGAVRRERYEVQPFPYTPLTQPTITRVGNLVGGAR